MFREDREAMRARVKVLEAKLAEAERAAEEARAQAREMQRLRSEVAALRWELDRMKARDRAGGEEAATEQQPRGPAVWNTVLTVVVLLLALAVFIAMEEGCSAISGGRICRTAPTEIDTAVAVGQSSTVGGPYPFRPSQPTGSQATLTALRSSSSAESSSSADFVRSASDDSTPEVGIYVRTRPRHVHPARSSALACGHTLAERRLESRPLVGLNGSGGPDEAISLHMANEMVRLGSPPLGLMFREDEENAR